MACSHNQFPPFPLPGSSQCRSEVGRRGSGAGGGTTGGHVASAAGFHPEMPSGTLALGDTTKPQEIHREGGVGFPGNLCFTPASDPLAELHGPQVLQALLFRQHRAWIYVWGQHKPIRRAGRGQVSRHVCGCSVGWRVPKPCRATGPDLHGQSWLQHPLSCRGTRTRNPALPPTRARGGFVGCCRCSLGGRRARVLSLFRHNRGFF